MDVYTASETQKNDWDNIVDHSESGTFFHTWDFLKIMHAFSKKRSIFFSLHQKFFPLIVEKNDRIKAICPIFVYQSPFTTIISSPPYGVENYYLGPVVLPESTSYHKSELNNLKIFSALDEYFKSEIRANYIQLNTPPGNFDVRFSKWNGYRVIPRFTYGLSLNQNEEVIWKNFSRSLRYYITKSREYGINMVEGSEKDVLHIYDMLAERNRIHAPREYILQVYKAFKGKNIKVFIAKKDEIPLTGILLIYFKNRAHFWCGAPKFSYRDVSPNECLLWESMKWAQSEGFELFEIMGADDPSLFHFKSKFNAHLIPYYSLQWATPTLRFGNEIMRLFSKKNII